MKYNRQTNSCFQQFPKDKITKTIKILDPKKVVQLNDIPTKLIKVSVVFSLYIYIYIYIYIYNIYVMYILYI